MQKRKNYIFLRVYLHASDSQAKYGNTVFDESYLSNNLHINPLSLDNELHGYMFISFSEIKSKYLKTWHVLELLVCQYGKFKVVYLRTSG